MIGQATSAGIRLAVGSGPRQLLAGVLRECVLIAVAGIVAGALGGIAVTSLLPAIRASRVDV